MRQALVFQTSFPVVFRSNTQRGNKQETTEEASLLCWLIVLLCSKHMSVCQNAKDVKALVSIQRRGTKLVTGRKAHDVRRDWEQRPGLSSLKKRQPRSELLPSAIPWVGKLQREMLSSVPWSWWNSTVLHHGRLRLDTRKHSFTMRMVKHWNGLHREVLFLSVVKAVLFIICFDFWLALKWSGTKTNCSLKVPSNWAILFCLLPHWTLRVLSP